MEVVNILIFIYILFCVYYLYGIVDDVEILNKC